MIWIILSVLIAVTSLINVFRIKAYYVKRNRDIEVEIARRIETEITEKIKENERIAGHLTIQAVVIEQHRKINVEQYNEVLQLANEVREQRNKVMSIHNENMALLKQARDSIKDNKQQHFYVKESSLWLYDHYKKVVEIINQGIKNEISYQDLYALHNTASNNLSCVREYFIKYFNVSPEEYSNQKVNIMGRKQDGDEHQLNFSKN